MFSNKDFSSSDVNPSIRGGIFITGNGIVSGNFGAIFCLEDCTIESLSSNKISGDNPFPVEITQGVTIFGRFYSVKQSGGSIIAYHG